jgi:hypothetical protein
MSGADIPYQLRPNKFIDRQLFLEALSRLIIPRGVEKYVYASMGGRHLVDHHAIYSALGVRALFSFDMSANEVARQKFNRPTGDTICVVMNSAKLPAEIDSILARFPSKENLIVWLDYTGAKRREQFQEVVQTLVRLKHGDIFRVTLNANLLTLGHGNQWRDAGAPNPAAFRAEQLRAQIPEFFPTNIPEISNEALPGVLAQCIKLATESARMSQPNLRFAPILITSYSDGTPMVTVVCAVSEEGQDDQFPGAHFARWAFACKGWNDVQTISVPVLSLKEQYKLDANLHRGVKRMLAALKFLLGDDADASITAIKSYKALNRFYPTFRHIADS